MDDSVPIQHLAPLLPASAKTLLHTAQQFILCAFIKNKVIPKNPANQLFHATFSLIQSAFKFQPAHALKSKAANYVDVF
ncbi:hypothetical protein [Phragmitibacter flavus]|uniref:hypothetical protein n=1 Tax=Phragmitibacter flavus TaxID=2576071 RepID=UPI00140A7328|nr:hypothetical protein [Phragmitibacter flavus]